MKVRWYLAPFALIWWLIIYCRNLLYNVGILKSTKFSIPTIVIGNLSSGGTGKTPHTIYLIQLLKQDFKVAVLSRGYKRKSKGFQIANYDSTERQMGDEPMQFFNRFKNRIIVSVSEKRVPAIKKLLNTFDLDVILLDDAYQHRSLKAGYNILLTTYDEPYSQDYILPMGNLREPAIGAKRANTIVVTKCPIPFDEIDKDSWRKKLKLRKSQSLYFSTIVYGKQWIGNEFTIDSNQFIYYNVLLVTGLANDTLFKKHVAEQVQKVEHLSYADHHDFTEGDVKTIKKKFAALTEPKIILTSEKDYMRLKFQYAILRHLYYLPIETKIDSPESFKQEIISYVHKV